MSELAARPWTVDQFFDWQAEQDERYEFVGGFPLKMMTGASNRHDDIVVNTLTALRTKLRGGPCRPFTADGSVETHPGQIRRPDIGVDCGPRDPDAYIAAHPVAVFEVLCRSTRNFDRFRKIEEYKAMASLRHIVFIEQDSARLLAWSRADDGAWTECVLEGAATRLELPALGIALSLADIYDQIDEIVRSPGPTIG